jgi:hypothetical protein
MDWQALAAVATVATVGGTVGGGWLALYVKDRSRTEAKAQFEALIKAALAEFQTDLMAKLNGTYMRSELAQEKFSVANHRIADLEGEVRELHQYAHSRAHQLANEIQKVHAKGVTS